MVRIEWNIGETEPSGAVCDSRPIKVADRVVNLNCGVGNNGTGRIPDGSVKRCRVGLGMGAKAGCQAENYYKRPMKGLLVRSRHEYLQKKRELGLPNGRRPTLIGVRIPRPREADGCEAKRRSRTSCGCLQASQVQTYGKRAGRDGTPH